MSTIVLLACTAHLAAFAETGSVKASGPVAADWASSPELSRVVSVSAVSRSMSDALAQISLDSGVELTVRAPAIKYQRITLIASGVPLSLVMKRIVATISHTTEIDKQPQYEWAREAPTAASGNATFVLKVTARAATALEYELDRPRREALLYLMDLRDAMGLPEEKRLTHPHFIPDGWISNLSYMPYAAALTGLTDEQLSQLIEGTHIVVPSAPLMPAMQKNYDSWVSSEKARGSTKNFEAFHPGAEAWYSVAVSESAGVDEPVFPPVYCITLYPGRSTTYVSGGVNLGSSGLTGPEFLPLAQDPRAPVIDLAPILNGVGVSPAQRHDVGFNVAAVAKAADINIYLEQFVRLPKSGQGLRTMKGTVADVINGLCNTWNLQVTREGDDYLLRDRDWGRMCVADVSDQDLDRIRKTIARHYGKLTDADDIDLCTQFNWLQMILTIPVSIPEARRNFGYRTYLSKRLVGLLSDDERTAAMQPLGIPVGGLSVRAQTFATQDLDYSRFLRQYHPESAEGFSRASLMLARLHLSPDVRDNSELPYQTGFVRITAAQGAEVWRTSSVR